MANLNHDSYENLLHLPTCGGLLENGKCRWLRILACTGASCSFYQKTNSLANAQERLRLLDEAEQEHIAQKYYGGSRPWAETGKKMRGERNCIK